MQPKISVIIVVFNGAKTLPQAIESVLRQTYKNVELIVVDGGSTDGTLDILRKYGSSNFIWKSEPDKGIYDAMNKGIMMANGEWIYFLGADDTIKNDTVFENVFNKESHTDVDFLYGNAYFLSLKRLYDGPFDEDKILFRNVCHQSIFYKKSIHDKVGYYNLRYQLFADWDFNIRCFFNSEIKRKYIDVVIANYAKGGLSNANNDLLFFRNVLFPKNLWALQKNGIKKLNNVIFYDKWWRLLRSMKLIGKKDSLADYVFNENLPRAISNMFSFQRKIPFPVLRIGVFSKFFMFISYCLNVIETGLHKFKL
jgi:Glycosyltransferases involved in cell wall biogenesis